MILVFGGTTEGKQVIEVLETLQLQYIYSTKTAIKIKLNNYGIYRFGAFSVESLELFILNKNITTIIHASHPFAVELHKTIDVVAKKCKIPVYRLQRKYVEQIKNPMVYYVDNYENALTLLMEKFNGKTLLALTGVQTIIKFKNFWKNNLSYFRILNRQSSIDIALKSNFEKKRLILGYPNTLVEAEVALFQQKNSEVVITKESGNSGALFVKIAAAEQCNIPIIIIKKPKLPTSFQLIKSKVALLEVLKTIVK